MLLMTAGQTSAAGATGGSACINGGSAPGGIGGAVFVRGGSSTCRVGLSLSEVGRDKPQAVCRFDFLCEQWFNRHNGPTGIYSVHQKWATAAPAFWFWHSHGVAEELLLPQLVAAQVGLVVNYILNRAEHGCEWGGSLWPVARVHRRAAEP